MKIHRYIYTRLSKEQSPSGKNGFQSAFLPADLLTSKEVLEIESHIHYPEGAQIEGQTVMFFKQIKGQKYLVLLLLRPLADVRDEHGRAGTFLCEGFLIAEADWQPIWLVTDLLELLQPHLFPGLDAILSAPAVDRAAGRIADLEIEVPADHWEHTLRRSEDEPDEQMLMVMYHVARGTRDLSMVLEGDPAAVTAKLQMCHIFIPDQLRTAVGWDDAFDGGKIFFSPLKIFGYSATMPTTGRPVVFATDGSATWTDPELAIYGKPTDPFSVWLQEVSVNPVPRAQLTAMYALSEALVSGRPTGPDMQTDPIFEAVNRDHIRKAFELGISTHLDAKWVAALGQHVSTSQQLRLWMQSFEIGALTELLESTILTQGLAPEIIGTPPPASFIQRASPVLKVLESMWTLKSPAPELLAQLPDSKMDEVLELMFGRGPHDKCPFMEMAEAFAEDLGELASDSKLATNLLPYICAKVPAEYAGFQDLMASMAMKMELYGALKGEPIDWLKLVDIALRTDGTTIEVWKAAKQLPRTTNLDNYPSLRAFAFAEKPTSNGLIHEGEPRRCLLKALIDVHGLNKERLEELGFHQEEIGVAESEGGIFQKFKRLFRF